MAGLGGQTLDQKGRLLRTQRPDDDRWGDPQVHGLEICDLRYLTLGKNRLGARKFAKENRSRKTSQPRRQLTVVDRTTAKSEQIGRAHV